MLPALSWITSVDLDDSILCNCYQGVNLVDRFPVFESFIDTVLTKLSADPDQSLTKFRLRLGRDISGNCHYHQRFLWDSRLHYMKPDRLYKWISYPLTKHGLRELDLSFYVANPSECKLPPQLFDFQSLEVLKLSSNLEIKIDSGVELFPLIRLPNLKILHLSRLVFTEDHFLTGLVSSCHVIEELNIVSCEWKMGVHVAVSSHSLRRFVLRICLDEDQNSELVLIDTPNLQYFEYADNVSQRYSIPHLNTIVKAHIDIKYPLAQAQASWETSLLMMRCLLDALSNVQHLSLYGCAAENYEFVGKLEDPLPVFRNLKTLELGPFEYGSRWDITLLLLLDYSPFLETLVFSEGLFEFASEYHIGSKDAVLEAEGWRTTQTNPSCFLTHLKLIELKRCLGYDRELNMIEFLLSKALVLKEFVIGFTSETLSKDDTPERIPIFGRDLDLFRRLVDDLPMASDSCSIIYTNSVN